MRIPYKKHGAAGGVNTIGDCDWARSGIRETRLKPLKLWM